MEQFIAFIRAVATDSAQRSAIRRLLMVVASAACLALPPAACDAVSASVGVGAHSDAPSPSAADEIIIISTRGLGTRCDWSLMAEGLRCEQRFSDAGGAGRWRLRSWSELAAELARPMPTIVYVHGNRIASGEDKSHGMALYRSIAARRRDNFPVRYIIWSWPSAQIPGPMKDYQVKAARTKYVSWQLAWAIDHLPAETPLTLVGYSYGARVVTGSLHLLAGGRLGGLQLEQRQHAQRPPVKAALLAAALDADWIRANGYHGHALEQVDEMILVNNHLDPAMRFYHMAFEGRVRPLGYAGLASRSGLGEFATRIRSIDATRAVGRHHALEAYLAAPGAVSRILSQVAEFPADVPSEQPATESQRASTPPDAVASAPAEHVTAFPSAARATILGK